MTTSLVEAAVTAAHQQGRALLKFLSANDCGLTGSHQCGMYLPRRVWPLFAPFPPSAGRLDKHEVAIDWQHGERSTDSVVTWYGQKSRREYRLTRFGRDFPYLRENRVGDLLVLVPTGPSSFAAFVFESADDIADVQASLGVEAIDGWGVFDPLGASDSEREDDCILRQFREFAEHLTAFPGGDAFSGAARDALVRCVHGFAARSVDQRLVELVHAEYDLFKLVESRLCESEVRGPFSTIDDFLKTAASIMNRRKSRAGRSMENHVGNLLREARIPFDPRPRIEGEPDVVIPSKSAYDDGSYPTKKLFMLGIKTTCKDRWRQVTREAPRIATKHLITLQEGISESQLSEMRKQEVVLVVPRRMHVHYPTAARKHLMDFEGFITLVRRAHP
jgi:hypothetical protein